MKKIMYPALLGLLFVGVAGCEKDTFPNLTPKNTPGVGLQSLVTVSSDTSTLLVNYDESNEQLQQEAHLPISLKDGIEIDNSSDAPFSSGTHRITVAYATFTQLAVNYNLGPYDGSVGIWGDVNGWRRATEKETLTLLKVLGPAHRPDSAWLVCMGSYLGVGYQSASLGSYFAYGSGGLLGSRYDVLFIRPDARWVDATLEAALGTTKYVVLMVRR